MEGEKDEMRERFKEVYHMLKTELLQDSAVDYDHVSRQWLEQIGTDIEEFKCSWLVVKALEVCNEEQKKLLCDNYGKSDPAHVDVVKCLYKDLSLQGIFAEYEIEMYEKLSTSIEALPSKSVQSMLKSYLGKMFKRQK